MQILEQPYLAVDNWLIATMLVIMCVVAMLIIIYGRHSIALQIDVLVSASTSSKGRDALRMQNTAATHITHVVSTIVCALCLTVMLTLNTKATPLALGIGIAYWLAYFVLRRMLMGYVNWTLFDTDQCTRWTSDYRLATNANAVLWTLAAMIMACNRFDNCTLLVIAAIALLPGRIILICADTRLFSANLFGCLHNLLYLCTLELIPPLGAVLLFLSFEY